MKYQQSHELVFRRKDSFIRKVLFVFLYFCFLYPVSISINGAGVSANYLYILFPLAVAFFKWKVRVPSEDVTLMLMLYSLIFIVGLIYQYHYYDLFYRRLISFVLFVSVFSYVYMRVDSDMVMAFKSAIVIISIIFIVRTIDSYFSLGGNDLGAAGKGAIGSQRYGFVYLMAFWIAVLYKPQLKIMVIFKLVSISLIVTGLLLTFSRSSIVALVGSLVMYIYYSFSNKKILRGEVSAVSKKRLIAMLFGVGFIVSLLEVIFPSVFDFYNQRLFSFLTGDGNNAFDFEDPNASEGYRIYMLQRILEFVGMNPFTGSSFLGVWVMFDDHSGSAHNQYADVLFRTGLFGFLAYIYLLYKLFNFLRNNHQDLFYGFICVLIYGLVHETFKLSHGGFIFAFLLGMMVSLNRYKDKIPDPNRQ